MPSQMNLTPELAALISKRFAALSDPTRLRLLNVMHAQGELAVGDLAELVDASHANTSKHLSLLLGERMVSRRREGARALYRIADPTLMALCDQVCSGVRDQLADLTLVVGDSGTSLTGARL